MAISPAGPSPSLASRHLTCAALVSGASVILLTLAACGGRTTAPRSPEVSRIAVTPDSAWLKTGDSVQLSAALYGPSGTIVSGSATWQVDSSDVARVNQAGLVTALGPGEAVVTLKAGTAAATARIAVGLTGTYTLKLVAGVSVPGQVPVTISCPNGDTTGTVTAKSGSLTFSDTTNLVRPALDILFQCSGSSSEYYSSMVPWDYSVIGGIVQFSPTPSWTSAIVLYGAARMLGDSLNLHWMDNNNTNLRDSLAFTFVKQ